jgi:prepilin-type N-terminal cleavage/methylation domain-containing protein
MTTALDSHASGLFARDRQAPSVRSRSFRSSEGFTLLEVLLVVTITGILSGIAVPSLLRGRAAANETSAIGSLRSTHTAQLSYALTCGFGFYAAAFPALGVGPLGPGFLSDDLTASPTPTKSGFLLGLLPGAGGVAGPPDCNGNPNTNSAYYVTAVPLSTGNTGTRGFATNQGGAIWQDLSGAAPVEPFTLGPGVSPVQ